MLFIQCLFVLAQGGCIIIPVIPTTLTAAGGVLASGTKNVMIQCNCTDDDGVVVDPVQWYDPDGTRLVSTQNSQYMVGTPYYMSVVESDESNIILVIPTFTDSYVGTYTCGRMVDSGLPGSPTATVNLTIGGELMINIFIYICFYQLLILLCICMTYIKLGT